LRGKNLSVAGEDMTQTYLIFAILAWMGDFFTPQAFDNDEPLFVPVVLDSQMIDVLDLLVDADDIGFEDDQCRTAITYAAQSGSVPLIEYLVAHGADIYGDKGCIEDSPLYYAMSERQSDAAAYLMKSMQRQPKITGVMIAAEVESVKMMQLALDIEGCDMEPTTYAMNAACRYNNVEIVKILVDRGADSLGLYSDDWPPLATAIRYCSYAVALYLLRVECLPKRYWRCLSPIESVISNSMYHCEDTMLALMINPIRPHGCIMRWDPVAFVETRLRQYHALFPCECHGPRYEFNEDEWKGSWLAPVLEYRGIISPPRRAISRADFSAVYSENYLRFARAVMMMQFKCDGIPYTPCEMWLHILSFIRRKDVLRDLESHISPLRMEKLSRILI
jgi:ankyrin repeat protein